MGRRISLRHISLRRALGLGFRAFRRRGVGERHVKITPTALHKATIRKSAAQAAKRRQNLAVGVSPRFARQGTSTD